MNAFGVEMHGLVVILIDAVGLRDHGVWENGMCTVHGDVIELRKCTQKELKSMVVKHFDHWLGD